MSIKSYILQRAVSVKHKLLISDYLMAHFIFTMRQILGKKILHTTFQVQTELDLKNYSSAVPALPPFPKRH